MRRKTIRTLRTIKRITSGFFECVGFLAVMLGACAMDSEDQTIPLLICVAGLASMLIGIALDETVLRRR